MDTQKWLRQYSDKWDMPVGELVLYIKAVVHENDGNISAILEMLDAPEEDRHYISATLILE